MLARRELYDLRADPGERHDLLAAAAPSAVALERKLQSALKAFADAGGSPPAKARLDREVLDRLRALGYVN
jgi:hypothetical protein